MSQMKEQDKTPEKPLNGDRQPSRKRIQNNDSEDNPGGTSLVAQWLRIHLPMQGTWVRALVQEDPTCRSATKPVRHNY